MSQFKGVLFCALTLSLAAMSSGCSTLATPEKLSEAARVKGTPAQPVLYANLGQDGDGRWRLMGINATGGGVRLNDFTVTLPPSQHVSRGALGMLAPVNRLSEKQPLPERPLHGFRASPVTALVTPFMLLALPSVPIYLIGGEFRLAGNSTLPIYGKYGPSQSLYRKALVEAKTTDGFEQRLPALVERYGKLLARRNNLLEDTAAFERKLRGAREAALEQWRQGAEAAAWRQVRISVVNTSGWPAPLSQEQLKDTLRLAVANRPWSPPDLSQPGHGIFPATTLAEFEQSLAAAESDLPNLGRAVAGKMASYASYDAGFRHALESGDAEIRLEDKGVRKYLGQWRYSFDYPRAIELKGGALSGVACYCVTLEAREFSGVVPASFRAEDKSLSAVWTSSGIQITNKTNNYLTVDAVTVYYEGDAETRGGEKFANYQELAPGTSVTVASPFSARDARSFTVTRDEAARQTLRFGLALKYRVTGDSTPRSLSRREDLPLLPLLSARL